MNESVPLHPLVRPSEADSRLLLDGSGMAAYPLTKRMLPTGMTSLREIRKMDCYYVDKTEHARRLVERGKCNFLSRPRRFGKSLLVDTPQELFEGSEELFRGFAVHDGWDWSARRCGWISAAWAVSTARTGFGEPWKGNRRRRRGAPASNRAPPGRRSVSTN